MSELQERLEIIVYVSDKLYCVGRCRLMFKYKVIFVRIVINVRIYHLTIELDRYKIRFFFHIFSFEKVERVVCECIRSTIFFFISSV